MVFTRIKDIYSILFYSIERAWGKSDKRTKNVLVTVKKPFLVRVRRRRRARRHDFVLIFKASPSKESEEEEEEEYDYIAF